MPSERVQRQINRFLDEAEAAIAKSDWPTVRTKANADLRLDPQNADALTFLAAAEREPNGAGRWERRRAAEASRMLGLIAMRPR